MKLFTKETKKIIIDGCAFHCLIDQTPNHEFVTFKIYPSRTKTSHVLISFTWAAAWHINLHKPNVCAKLVKYTIEKGWDPTKEKKVMIVEQGDFLIKELDLDV